MTAAVGAPGLPATAGDRASVVAGRLPAGAVALARRHLLRAAGTVDRLWHPSTPAPAAGQTDAEDHLVRPVQLDPHWPEPPAPLPAPGGGEVHADLTDEDHEALARLREVLVDDTDPSTVDAERLAAAAQAWRLAVTPYRPPRPGHWIPPKAAGPSATDRPGPARHRPRADRFLVVDLTALWAGPLATSLLASLGVRVVKVDSRARPDALADHPAVHRHLNDGKEVIDLDLRHPQHRARFEDLVARADLVVDAFSRRVMPNFGYGPERLAALAAERGNPGLATLSLVAFPAHTPERDWIAYGPGVHATVGPASVCRRPVTPAPIAYPDPLTGLAALATAVEVLGRPERLRGRPGGHHELSLAATIGPLASPLSLSPRGRPGARSEEGPGR